MPSFDIIIGEVDAVQTLAEKIIELEAELSALAARVEKAERMSRLWKALAKRWHVSGWTALQYSVLMYREQCRLKREAISRAEKAEAERDALRRDARIVAIELIKDCNICKKHGRGRDKNNCDNCNTYLAVVSAEHILKSAKEKK